MLWFGPNMTDDKVKQIMDFQFRELTEDKQYISHDSCDIWICLSVGACPLQFEEHECVCLEGHTVGDITTAI